jgi:peptidyl-Lys metalloendopeptidase
LCLLPLATYLCVFLSNQYLSTTLHGRPHRTTFHKYLYAVNDPVNEVDPSGHEIDEIVGAIVIGLTAAAIIGIVAYTALEAPKDATVVGPIAKNNAELLVISAIATIDNGGTGLFRLYFGNPASRARMEQVEANYEKIEKVLFDTITYHKSDRNLYGYVYQNLADQIWLGSLFFSAPWVGFDSKPGTIVHEASHLAKVATDLRYGEPNAEGLARSAPDLAVQNADNYEHFAERPNLYGDWGAPNQ